MIEVINVKKDYVKGKLTTKALKGISFTLNDHGFISILGPSGCGKSTLLNLLGLLDRPTEGKILIDNEDLSSISTKRQDELRNKKIGFIFQSYHLIPTLTAYENVSLPLSLNTSLSKKEVKEKAEKLLKDVGLFDLKNKYPSELSGGQAQRVAIARSLVNDPTIILADEPTGALDSENSLEITKILKDISAKHLVVVVTHNNELAYKYSDQIIHLLDGKIEKIEEIKPLENSKTLQNSTIFEKKHSFKENIIWKLALKNMFSKKWKTLLTSVANCFGLVSLGFILAITYGFSLYQAKISYQTASNMPINVPAYTIKSNQDDWKDINNTEIYTSKEEIYPYINSKYEYTYTYNSYTQSYFDLLDELVEKGYAYEYIINYGNDFSYNLVTEFPESLNGNSPKNIGAVNTELSAGGDYTSSSYGVPTNIFHELYGNIDENYDLLVGSLPKSKNDLVLVVNEYNSINFNILKALGFYNPIDTSDEVKASELSSKVKPISFSDILDKTYKIFPNDVFYTQKNVGYVNDFFSRIVDSQKEIITYEQNNLNDLYFDNEKGIELKISGIIRPKEDSAITLLSPSLCYSSELLDTLQTLKESSAIASTISNNLIGIDDKDSYTERENFRKDFNELITKYNNGKVDINSTTFNEIANKYFSYIYVNDEYHAHDSSGKITKYYSTSFSNFLKYSRKFGADLVSEEVKSIGSSGDIDKIVNILERVLQNSMSSALDEEGKNAFYKDFISIGAFINSYSQVNNIAIVPKDLDSRNKIIQILDQYNNSQAKESDRIYYIELNNWMISDVGNLVSLISTVLALVVTVLVLVACAMNILFTYNSVLERTKDIGILRAIGTKKFDVSRLFLNESALIGSLSGVFSCLFAYLLTFPVNSLVKEYYPNYFSKSNLCVFTYYHALILIGIGIILAVFSSILPSYKASRKDPVECLRSE